MHMSCIKEGNKDIHVQEKRESHDRFALFVAELIDDIKGYGL